MSCGINSALRVVVRLDRFESIHNLGAKSDDAAADGVLRSLDVRQKRCATTGSTRPEWTRTAVLEFPGSADGPWRR